MKDTDYAYAVARIRANERKLLKLSDIEALIAAKNSREAEDYLKQIGWVDSSKEFDLNDAIENQSKELWTLLKESVPDCEQLKVFTIETDFYNLKAAIKCMLTGEDANKYFSFPTSLDLKNLEQSIKLHEFDKLPSELSEAAKEAYKTARTTENGQFADIIIDKAALNALIKNAEKSGSDMVKEIANFLCAAADIKISVRCHRTGRDRAFTENALCACDFIDIKELSSYAEKSEAELIDYLKKTKYGEGAQLIEKDTVAFEKWVDDTVIEITKKAKYEFFGFEPICAYIYSKRNEIKTVRIIISAKRSGISAEEIRTRVRKLYA